VDFCRGLAVGFRSVVDLSYSLLHSKLYNKERERERERVYSPNKHNIRYNTIAKTQGQAAREAKHAYQGGRPYGNITSVTQYIKRKKNTNKIHA